jgi:hypothetical protein
MPTLDVIQSFWLPTIQGVFLFLITAGVSAMIRHLRNLNDTLREFGERLIAAEGRTADTAKDVAEIRVQLQTLPCLKPRCGEVVRADA